MCYKMVLLTGGSDNCKREFRNVYMKSVSYTRSKTQGVVAISSPVFQPFVRRTPRDCLLRSYGTLFQYLYPASLYLNRPRRPIAGPRLCTDPSIKDEDPELHAIQH